MEALGQPEVGLLHLGLVHGARRGRAPRSGCASRGPPTPPGSRAGAPRSSGRAGARGRPAPRPGRAAGEAPAAPAPAAAAGRCRLVRRRRRRSGIAAPACGGSVPGPAAASAPAAGCASRAGWAGAAASRLRRCPATYSMTPVESRPNRLFCVSSAGSGIICRISRALATPSMRDSTKPSVGRQRQLLEAQQRVARQRQHAVDVAERVAHDVGVAHRAHRLEDQLAGRELERDLAGRGLLGLVLEGVEPVRPGEQPRQHLVHVERDRVLEPVRVEQAELGQHLAEPALVAHHHLGGARQVGRGQQAPPHQHLAEPVLHDVRVRVDDVAAAEAQALLLVAAHEVQRPAAPADVHGRAAARAGRPRRSRRSSRPRPARLTLSAFAGREAPGPVG